MLYPIQETSEVQTSLNSSQNRREKQGNGAETGKSRQGRIIFQFFRSVQAL